MGKYEKKPGQSQAVRYAAARRAAGSPPPRRKKKQEKSRVPLILALALSVVVILACAVGYVLFRDDGKIARNVYVGGINIGGMTKEEAKVALQAVTMDEDMNIRFYTRGSTFPLYTTTYDPSTDVPVDIYGKPIEGEAQETSPTTAEETPVTDDDAPLDAAGKPYLLDKTLTLLAEDVDMKLDIDGAVEDAYKVGRDTGSKLNMDRVDVDVTDHLTLNDGYIRDALVNTLDDTTCVGTDTRIIETTTTINDRDGNPKTVDALEIDIGTMKRDIDVSALYQEIISSYTSGRYDLQYVYDEEIPEPCDLDALYEKYDCVKPVNAVCDEETYEITEGKEGFGFLMSDAVKAFSQAKPGDSVVLTLCDLEPEYTAESLKNQLFCDVLASYDSKHSTYSSVRTHNLELAAQAIDGTIVRPGEIFSFNDVVGERTAEKGYGEAGVYVGGRTENQLGGGVCQVASVIYYCTLQSDLEVVERYEHQYAPEYVPWGMDATIYWGSLDYRWRNNTPYPIRIDASVSDGYVHVALVGTETKDYTVKLDYEVTYYNEAGEKTIDIYPGMYNYDKYKDCYEGEVIQTAYDGVNVTTYRYKYDKDGNLLDKEVVNYSKYDRRDKEIAHIVSKEEPTEPSTEPTKPTTEAPAPTTEAPTPTTEPSTDSTNSGE